MLQKPIYTLIFTSFMMQMSLSAMDMERVNALAEKIRSGQSITTTKQTPVIQTAPQAVTPSIEVVEPPQESTTDVTHSSIGTMSEESLGLRKTNLYVEGTDTVGEETNYSKTQAGESQKFERAFENAPPMIPHDTEGMLPITTKNNACTDCHLPNVAADMKATPIPMSHFASFRPKTTYKDGEFLKEGKTVNNTSDIKTTMTRRGGLSSERFNCSQCHAPQSTQAPLVGNTFKADFRTSNGSNKSNLIDVLNEGVK